MDIEDSQRLVTEIEMLKVVLYLVRRERVVREEAARLGQKTRKKEKVIGYLLSVCGSVYTSCL